MGEKAHIMKLRTYWIDDAERLGYEDHPLLISAFQDKSLIDFEHPTYGLMQVKIQALAIRRDDGERCAEIDVTLIEQMRVPLDIQLLPNIRSSAQEIFTAGQEQQKQKLAEDIKSKLQAKDAGMLTKIMEEGKTLLSQAQEYSDKARALAGSVDGYIATATGFVNQIDNPTNTLQFMLDYGLQLPGLVLGPIARSVGKLAQLYNSTRNFPTQFLDNFQSGLDDIQAAFHEFGEKENGGYAPSAESEAAAEVMQTHLQIACAQAFALELAYIYDDDVRAASGDLELADVQVMNIRELEKSLAMAREMLDEAITNAREITALKDLSLSLLKHVNQIRLERERMITVQIDNPMPLHLVCLKYGLPYTDAERIHRVNKIRNPNFTSGEVLVYAG